MSPDPGAPLPSAACGLVRAGPDFARRVPNDLEPIFRGLPAVAAGDTVAPARIVRPSRQRRSLRMASFGAIVAASLAGLSAGALVGHPANLFGAHAAAAPTPALTPIAALDAPSGEATARLAPASQVQPEAPRIEASAPADPAAVRPIPVRVRAAPTHVQKAKLTSKARHRRGDVMAADRELRRAYARAIRAGAPHEILVDSRDRWDELRHQASYNPQQAAAGYWKLSERLDRVSNHSASRAAPAPRRHHGLLHLW